MHSLLEAADIIFQFMTDEMSDKEIGNSFWNYSKSKFLDDRVKKIKVTDFVYDYILHLNADDYKQKYNLNLAAIKKSKDQMTFVSEIISKMIKHSNIPLIDY